MSQDSALIIVMDASVSCEGRTNVLLTVVLLNMTDGVVHLLWYGQAFHLMEPPITMSSKGVRYRDELLDVYVRPFAGAVGDNFVLMDDNARPHRARVVNGYLEDEAIDRLDWPSRSPDLNPIEHA